MAQRAERDRQPARALDYYKRSARYADKFSQAMVARLYQEGIGTRADPVMAYIWMDLAAERMYHDFLVLREHYWARLDALQQAQAIERGQQVYADYGDRVAKPRMERRSGTGASRSPAAASVRELRPDRRAPRQRAGHRDAGQHRLRQRLLARRRLLVPAGQLLAPRA
jgi:TPR repeat protein